MPVDLVIPVNIKKRNHSMKIYKTVVIVISVFLMGCAATKRATTEVAQEETPRQENVELTERQKLEFNYLFNEATKMVTSGDHEKGVQYILAAFEIDPSSAATIFEYLFVEAGKQKLVGNLDLANFYYNACLKVDPESAATFYEIANIQLAKQEIINAQLSLKQAIELNPENKWYKLQLAQIYQSNKQYELSSDIYSELSRLEPNNIDYLYYNALLLTSAQKYNEAIEAYDQLENITGFNEQISLARQNLYRLSGNQKEAYKEAEKLIQFNPTVPEYYGVLADMYKEDGNTKKALEYYEKVLEIDPNNGFVHFSLATFYIQEGDYVNGFKHAEKGFSNPDVEIETKIQLYLMLTVSPEDIGLTTEDVENLIQLIVDAHPDDARSYSIMADFLIQNNRRAEAKDFMVKALDINPNTYPIWEQLIITENQLGDFEEMIKHSEKAMELFPTQPLLYVLTAVAYIQQNKYAEALNALETGIIYVADNKRMEAQFEMYRAEAYYNLDQSQNAFKSFEKVIEIEPDNFMAMNNYAYYLSVRGEELEKAEMLSGRVVQANPDNATYLDTHAWVLFKKGEYRLAKFYMDTALKNGGDQNDVVVEHYGDILFKLNDLDGALKYWNMSLEMGNDSEVLQQKIKEQKYIEGEE